MKPTPLIHFATLLNLSISTTKIVKGVSIDSRKICDGDLFFAIKGKKVDGHKYLEEVASKGAIGAVVEETYEGPSFGLELLFVKDVTLAIQELAKKVLRERSCKVVGITGSIGKTSTKEFVYTLLSSCLKVAKNPLSYNSKLTLPLSILLSDGDEDILILEMGMSERLDIERLVTIAPPDIAVITTIACQHTSGFSDGLIGVAKEKSSIFSRPETSLGLLNRDMEHYELALKTGSCPKKSFSIKNKSADYYLELQGSEVIVFEKGQKLLTLPPFLPMKEHYQNFLAAMAVALHFKVPLELIAKKALELKLPPMRFERVEKQGIVFINDAYNANPDSMKAALRSLPVPSSNGKKIAVLSEMDALGQYTQEGHSGVATLALEHVDILFCLGVRAEIMQDVWTKAKREVHFFTSKQELEKSLKKVVKKGDVVLLKGARAHALDEILNHF